MSEILAHYKKWWLTKTMLIIEEVWGYTVYLLEECDNTGKVEL